ncbi:zinc ABC transporter substrate-binding protein [Pseudoruegeria sp. HB172150]|uniref:zinc ABC transporter substrate-binding protein n=1 Tax=Pseudoruegeria sp. HB172150 TaxID=2721164 RepID=UPI0020A6D104|nr:zinc ABC transporter substrate-binding protein [Pseudoruegeria sp. HB172150]
MLRKWLFGTVFSSLAGAAAAEVPKVATDIPPVHALVSRVMDGAGEPLLILPVGASPHVYAMRPSEAAALEGSDVVFWVGEELTPWLTGALSTLAGDALTVPLLQAEGVERRPYRWGGEADDGHGHSHAAGATDPHAWFDPEAARVWLGVIAETLADADPENAALYAANAEAAQADLDDLITELSGTLAGASEADLIVYHDALQYFEPRFGLTAIGAMTNGEAAPGPRQLQALRELAAGTPHACIVMEPIATPGLGQAVAEGSGAKIVEIDTMGRELTAGPGYYGDLMRSIAGGLAGCS